MEVGYEIHSNMTAAHIDKTLCSQAHPYILSEKFFPVSPVLVAGLWEEGLGKGKVGRGLPEGKGREQADAIHTLKVKDQGGEDKGRKTGINTSGYKCDLECSVGSGSTSANRVWRLLGTSWGPRRECGAEPALSLL